MGHNISYSAVEIPGATSIYIQRPGGCCPERAMWNPQKPPELHMVPDAAWQTFSQQVHAAVSGMLDEQAALWAAGFGWAPGTILIHMARLHWILFIVGALLLIAGIAGPNMYRCQVNSKNQQQDHLINQAIAELQPHCPSLTIQYRTMYTECCRPKGSQPLRMISLSPMMMMMPMGYSGSAVGQAIQVASPLTQMMTVTVPPGVGPGQQLQIQTEQGPMSVVVPQGVAGGSQFQVQVPVSQVVQAVPANPAVVQGVPAK